MTATGATSVNGDGSLTRHVLVEPGMCSGGSLIFGRIGDWTWDAVAESCRTNVHAARTAEGRPAYLSFYYFRVRGGKVIHPHGLTFGDELHVTSRVFQLGTRSVLTLHRLAPADLALELGPFTPEEAYDQPHPDCFYTENFNRWIARAHPGSNERLDVDAPADFAYEHLPRLPNQYSPRTLVGRARQAATFHPEPPAGFTTAGLTTYEYTLDVVRDLNGAGLLYFAAYFSIFDTALLRLWRSLGRGDDRFLQRRVVDQKVGYFGNADPGTVFAITVRRWCSAAQPTIEIADMAMRDAFSGRLLAVSAIELDCA